MEDQPIVSEGIKKDVLEAFSSIVEGDRTKWIGGIYSKIAEKLPDLQGWQIRKAVEALALEKALEVKGDKSSNRRWKLSEEPELAQQLEQPAEPEEVVVATEEAVSDQELVARIDSEVRRLTEQIEALQRDKEMILGSSGARERAAGLPPVEEQQA